MLAWAVTIHKSQGMSVGAAHAWKRLTINLGDNEFAGGLTFVALSRACELDCISFLPGEMPTLERLLKARVKTIESRQLEDIRLEQLAEQTKKLTNRAVQKEFAWMQTLPEGVSGCECWAGDPLMDDPLMLL